MRLRLLLTAIISCCIPSPALSVVIYVNPDGTGDAPTIAAAYAMAVSGDDIQLAPGTYFEHDITMKSLVDLRSDTDDPFTTIVDAQGLGRCLDGGGLTGAPVIRGITFQNGTHAEEGGILLAGRGGTGGGHNARYFKCVFRNGTAPIGGAVVTRATGGAAPDFTLCLFQSNRSTGSDGGAIWSAGVGNAESCEFRQNEAARHGGAVYSEKLYDWGFAARNCLFDRNTAIEHGGAISSTGVGDIYGSYIYGCRFVGNVAAYGGAASLNEYDVVKYGIFLDNEASQAGGALYLDNIQPDKDNLGYYVENVFARNDAGAQGGAIYFLGSSTIMYVNSNTFVANGAPSGGHFWTSGSPTLSKCIFAFATTGGAGAGTETLLPTCTDVYGNAGGDFVGALINGGSIPSNFSADPLFCDAAANDFTLRESSPCLPAGPCGLIGAYGLGCTAVNAGAAVDATSWGRIKANYR